MDEPTDYEGARLDPTSTFAVPEDVLARADLTKKQKIEILRRWKYDEMEVAVAEEEGMAGDGGPPVMLRRVLLALERLTGVSDAGAATLTKHGGR